MAGRRWTEQEYQELFRIFPPSGDRPRDDDLHRLARRLDRTRDAVGWQWLDAHRYCAGLSTTAAPVLMRYLDRVGLCH
jgi:hypothetical protein